MTQVGVCLDIPQRMRLSGTTIEIWHFKDNGVTTLLFGVIWHHQSHDHSTRGGRLPIDGPLWPWVYLAPLWRYGHL